MQVSFIVITVVITYMVLMLLVGWYSKNMISDNKDFMVAGRRLGPILMAGTLAATEIGGGSSLGVVQQGMGKFGISSAWYVITMGIAFVILTFLAPKFRAATVKTVPEYFRRRYGKLPGIVTAIIMFLPLVGATAAQMIASAVILSTMVGISFQFSVIVICIIVTIYSIMGGLWSVTLTDFIQVFFIVFGMAVAIPYALGLAGGWQNVVANVPPQTFDIFKGYDAADVISLTIMYVTTFTVGQEAVSRYYAARDGKAAQKGSILAALINFIYGFIPAILGITVLALINMGSFDASLFNDVGSRYALPVLAIHAMPPLICGILFAGIISATMSSASSDLLGAGSIFANDIYREIINPAATDNDVMKITRITMVCSGLLSMLVALFNTSSIITILMFSFTLRAAGAFFPYVLGHYWKGASCAGTMASLVCGTLIVVYLEQFSKGLLFGVKIGQPILPGLIIGFISFILFSKFFPPHTLSTELTPDKHES
ncbi:sodium:solute symporter [Megasphaera cerevisiae DSM 20462]|jgi:SSS family solute:Na+ symporter|uniref:Sodium:solute symporter n=1 Tax=Megasphaera cerevisiae DSM 20462 TaxID=1122219 RepID=A0A0J6WUX4_9FIRM|nr:sodium:solute symporter family protein [Megasphaera cerevisiae]KMO86354.1 sodium:solute symporter [Megasphaera cerevisiae DSM 20462]OKY53433.1 sodium:solute symporter [Megasphaera cerevisiae]SKA00179.1 solute:Na+ symporter, SSS family [Megasphaera cerevisiae DSM 20462]